MTKPIKWHVHPAKTQISLGIHPVWSESSLSAWRKLGSLATHLAHSEDSDHTGGWNKMNHVMTKPIKWHVHPAKTQNSLGIHPVWSESSLSAWRKLLAHSEDYDHTGQMPRLNRIFARCTVICAGWSAPLLFSYGKADFLMTWLMAHKFTNKWWYARKSIYQSINKLWYARKSGIMAVQYGQKHKPHNGKQWPEI